MSESLRASRCVDMSRLNPSHVVSHPPFCAATLRLVRSHALKRRNVLSRLKMAIIMLNAASISIAPSSAPPDLSKINCFFWRLFAVTMVARGLLRVSVDILPIINLLALAWLDISIARPFLVPNHLVSEIDVGAPSWFFWYDQNFPSLRCKDSKARRWGSVY